MNLKHNLFLLFLILPSILFAQKIPKNKNKTDKSGLKQGTWTILFDENWEKVSSSDSAAFYRVISYQDSKPIGIVQDFYKDGRLQWEATLLADEPEDVEDGKVTWFYENGQKSETAYFKNGVRDGPTKQYTEEGVLYWDKVYHQGKVVEENIYDAAGNLYVPDSKGIIEMANYYNQLQNPVMEIYYWEKLIQLYDQNYGEKAIQDETYGIVLNNLAVAYNNNFEPQKAGDYYIRSLEVLENIKSSSYKDILTNTLAFLITANQAERANSLFDDYHAKTLEKLKSEDTFSKALEDEYLDVSWLQAKVYYNINEFAIARDYFLIGLNYLIENDLKNHPDYRSFVSFVGVCYQNDDLYTEAEPLLLENLELAESVSKETQLVALNNLFILYNDWKKDSLALVFTHQKRVLLEESLDTEQKQKDYLDAIYNEYLLTYRIGNQQQSIELLKTYVEKTEEFYGNMSQEYAFALNKYADLMNIIGESNLAEQSYQQAITVSQNTYGEASFELGENIQSLGDFYFQNNRFKKAEEAYLQSLSVYAQTSRQNHPRYTKLLYNLGWVKYTLGDYQSAEKHYLKAQEIEEKERGKETFNYQQLLTGFGLLYRVLGDYEKAKTYLEDALELAIKREGPRTRNVAICMDNLALVYSNESNYEKAIELNEEALSILKEILGQNHKSIAISLGNLAALYNSLGDYDKTNELYIELFTIFENIDDPEKDKLLASFFNNFALSRQKAGRFEKAEEFYQHSLDMLLKVYGEGHPKYLATLVNKANLYREFGKYEQAKELYEVWFPAKLEQYGNIFPSLTDGEKRNFYFNDKVPFDNFSIFGLSANINNQALKKEINKDWYDFQLSLKGILLNASQKARQQILNSGDQGLIAKYQEWQNLKDYIAQVANYSLEEREEENIDLEVLQNQANEKEAELALLSNDFATTFINKNPTWKEVQKALKTNEMAIEMVKVSYSDTSGTIINNYVALILMSNSDSPEVAILEEGERMETAYLRFYKNIINSQKTGGNREDKNSYAVYWQPIHDKLMELANGKPIEKIYFSPEGVYNEINVNTLYDTERQKYVLDDYDIHLLTSTRELITMERKTGVLPKDGTAFLFGRPDYILDESDNAENNEETLAENVSRSSTQFVKQISQANWSDLPGTEKEIKNISKVLDNAKYDYERKLGGEVTEEAVESLVNPTILHIATHGFFMPTDAVKDDPSQALLQSGLVLSGVTNYFEAETKPNREDGVLTAYEAMNMQLDETSLVVLSACETGTGEVQAGEGVYGLQRALKVAGANTLLMSLWKVNDEATQELMSTFYEEWIRTNDKREAFRNAQLKLREKYPQHYYWGAFVMIGE